MASLTQAQIWGLPLRSALDKIVLLRLSDFVDERGEHPRPVSLKQIAQDCSSSRDSVRRSLKTLVSERWVLVAPSTKIGIDPPAYRINLAKVRAVSLALWGESWARDVARYQAESVDQPPADAPEGGSNLLGGGNLLPLDDRTQILKSASQESTSQSFNEGGGKLLPLDDHTHISPLDPPSTSKSSGVRTDLVQVQVQDLDLGTYPTDDDVDTIVPPSPLGVRFKRFWAAYPRKTGRRAAWDVWLQRKPSEEHLQRMLTTLAWQKETEQWQAEGGKFIPHPRTWLHQAREDDEPTAPTKPAVRLAPTNRKNVDLVRRLRARYPHSESS